MNPRAWLVLGIACLPAALSAQVAQVVEIRGGEAVTVIRNPGLEVLQVTVELREWLTEGGKVTTGREIRALLSPRAFTLPVAASQTIRLRLREAVAPGSTLAFITTLTPSRADTPAPDTDTAMVARLVLVVRIVTRAVVQ